jgi:hypothetical protein
MVSVGDLNADEAPAVATDDGELQWRGRGQTRLPRHVFAELLGMVRSGHSRSGSIAWESL